MPLETGTYVDDLVTANPAGTDSRAQGDDHLRLIKSVLKNTFPNATRAFYFDHVVSKNAAYTATSSDASGLFLLDASTAAFTLTLPLGSGLSAGFYIVVTKTDSTANAVTIAGNGSDTINGAASRTLTEQYQVERYMWDGSAWRVISQHSSANNTRLKAIDLGGSANAYTLTTGLNLNSYMDGFTAIVVVNATNIGASTINVDSLGAKDIKKMVSGTATDLAAGDLVAGHHYIISYDASVGASGAFVVSNPELITTDRLADGSVTQSKLADNSVTLAKLSDIQTDRVIGRVSAGSGDPEELTPAQVKDVVVQSSSGGTSDFLRADGNWAPAYTDWIEDYTSAVIALNVLLKIDSTAPTTSEGVQISSISGVSVGAGQKVEIVWDVNAYLNDQPLTVALFRGTTCIAARATNGYAAPETIYNNSGSFIDAPSAGTYTYSLRAGPYGSTSYVNLNAIDTSGTAAPSSCVKSGMRLRVVG